MSTVIVVNVSCNKSIFRKGDVFTASIEQSGRAIFRDASGNLRSVEIGEYSEIKPGNHAGPQPGAETMITITCTPSDTAYKIIPGTFEILTDKALSRLSTEYWAQADDGATPQDVANEFLRCYFGDEVVEFDIFGCDGYYDGSFYGFPGQDAHPGFPG